MTRAENVVGFKFGSRFSCYREKGQWSWLDPGLGLFLGLIIYHFMGCIAHFLSDAPFSYCFC